MSTCNPAFGPAADSQLDLDLAMHGGSQAEMAEKAWFFGGITNRIVGNCRVLGNGRWACELPRQMRRPCRETDGRAG